MPLLEWFANNYKKFGATLEIVTDKSQEGSQFVKGFGGIGGKMNEIEKCVVLRKRCCCPELLIQSFSILKADVLAVFPLNSF